MKIINVIFVSTYLARNGTEAFMMNVFRNIDKSKYHIDFMCFSREDIAYEDEIEQSGSRVFVLPQRKEGFLFFKSLNSFFKEHHYDVLHWCACSCTTIAPLFFAYKNHVPIRITHSHNSSCFGWHNKLLHYALRPFMNIMTTNRLACSEKASKWFFGNRESLIIKNGININAYSFNESTRERVRREFGISDSTKVIGHVGRFDPVKNHDFIIDIFASFANTNNAKLMLIGIGALEKKIKEKVEGLNLEDKVLFLRERSDVPDLMQAMDLFLMPSLFEGLPFVLVEAQAAGLPCLVSKNIDMKVKLTPGITFYSIDESADTWSKEMRNVFANFKRCSTDEYIKESGFAIEETVSKLGNIYNK